MTELDKPQALIDEYVEQKEFVEKKKPYWLSFEAPRRSKTGYFLFNYFPAAHYEKAIDQAFEELAEENIEEYL